ncbi:MAG TPA: AraC family transcriptional regulator [Sphingomicrobium sp.]
MAADASTLGFGVTYDMVAAQTACGQLLTLTCHHSDDRIPPHSHVNDYLCIVLTGGFAERQRDGWRDRRGGCFFVHHAGETHHDCFGPRGATCLNLHFPEGEPGPPMDGMGSASAKIAAGELAFEIAAGSREELMMASLAAELIGEMGVGHDCANDRGKWIDTVVEAISDEPDRRWTLGQLAGIARRHRIHIAQAFRAKTGISLGAFQRRQRLTCLSLALRRGTRPLAALAAEFGYCDQSHMNSEFRTAFGISPGRYRREFH